MWHCLSGNSKRWSCSWLENWQKTGTDKWFSCYSTKLFNSYFTGGTWKISAPKFSKCFFCNSTQSWPSLFLLGCFLPRVRFYFISFQRCYKLYIINCGFVSWIAQRSLICEFVFPCNFIAVEVSEDISNIPFLMTRFSYRTSYNPS